MLIAARSLTSSVVHYGFWAKVVTDSTMTLANNDGIRDSNMPIGGFARKQELVFNLSDDEAF